MVTKGSKTVISFDARVKGMKEVSKLETTLRSIEQIIKNIGGLKTFDNLAAQLRGATRAAQELKSALDGVNRAARSTGGPRVSRGGAPSPVSGGLMHTPPWSWGGPSAGQGWTRAGSADGTFTGGSRAPLLLGSGLQPARAGGGGGLGGGSTISLQWSPVGPLGAGGIGGGGGGAGAGGFGGGIGGGVLGAGGIPPVGPPNMAGGWGFLGGPAGVVRGAGGPAGFGLARKIPWKAIGGGLLTGAGLAAALGARVMGSSMAGRKAMERLTRGLPLAPEALGLAREAAESAMGFEAQAEDLFAGLGGANITGMFAQTMGDPVAAQQRAAAEVGLGGQASIFNLPREQRRGMLRTLATPGRQIPTLHAALRGASRFGFNAQQASELLARSAGAAGIDVFGTGGFGDLRPGKNVASVLSELAPAGARLGISAETVGAFGRAQFRGADANPISAQKLLGQIYKQTELAGFQGHDQIQYLEEIADNIDQLVREGIRVGGVGFGQTAAGLKEQLGITPEVAKRMEQGIQATGIEVGATGPQGLDWLFLRMFTPTGRAGGQFTPGKIFQSQLEAERLTPQDRSKGLIELIEGSMAEGKGEFGGPEGLFQGVFRKLFRTKLQAAPVAGIFKARRELGRAFLPEELEAQAGVEDILKLAQGRTGETAQVLAEDFNKRMIDAGQKLVPIFTKLQTIQTEVVDSISQNEKAMRGLVSVVNAGKDGLKVALDELKRVIEMPAVRTETKKLQNEHGLGIPKLGLKYF